MTRPTWTLALVAVGALFTSTAVDALGIRHDREDSRHLDLADEFPEVGSVSGLGTATLIHPRWALSAAHVGEMLKRMLPEGTPLTVAFGDRSYRVEEIVYPPERIPIGSPSRDAGDSTQTNAHDIALLRLDRPVEDLAPAVLYGAADERGREVIIVGCGALMPRGDRGAVLGPDAMKMPRGTPRAGTNRIEGLSGGEWILVATFDGPEEALDLEAAPFLGDSGGPAYVEIDDRYEIVGVIAEVDTGADERLGNYGDVINLTRTSRYLEWIRATVGSP